MTKDREKNKANEKRWNKKDEEIKKMG